VLDSIDGLAPEHGRRRTPATYARILKHIAPHRVIVHCTVTRQIVDRPGYVAGFCGFWSERPDSRKICSAFTRRRRMTARPSSARSRA
jgi:hypothetical protein